MMCACIKKAMAARKRERFSSIDAFSKYLLEIQNSEGKRKENSQKRGKQETYSHTSNRDEQTRVENGVSQEDTINDSFNGISIFSFTKENQLYYCNANIWQCFDMKSTLCYDNFYSIYPAKEVVRC